MFEACLEHVWGVFGANRVLIEHSTGPKHVPIMSPKCFNNVPKILHTAGTDSGTADTNGGAPGGAAAAYSWSAQAESSLPGQESRLKGVERDTNGKVFALGQTRTVYLSLTPSTWVSKFNETDPRRGWMLGSGGCTWSVDNLVHANFHDWSSSKMSPIGLTNNGAAGGRGVHVRKA